MATPSAAVIVKGDHTVTAQWALGNADTGISISINRWPNQTVQVGGTIGGATVVLEGSNDNATFFTLNDKSATAVPLSFAAAGLKDVRELPVYIRAKSSGGAGSAIVVTVSGSGGQE